MDEAAARLYCEAQLRKRDHPPAVDIDDLVQEYLLAELEGECPKVAVARALNGSARDARYVETHPRMGFAVCEEIDMDTSDEEQDDYQELEREISEDAKAERVAMMHRLMDQLLPQESEALRLVIACQGDEAIAVTMGLTVKQVRYLREAGIARLRELAHPEEVELVLFGVKDTQAKPRETYVRHTGPRYKPQEPTLLDAG